MIFDNDSQRWRTLYEISRYLHELNTLDGAHLLQGVLERIGQHTHLRSGCIISFDDQDNIEDALTLDMDSIGTGLWEHLYDRGLLGFVHHSQRTIVIRDITRDTRWPHPMPPGVRVPQQGSAIGVPLLLEGKSVGVMMFVHPKVDGFDAKATAMLEEIGLLVAQTVSKTRSRRTERHNNEQFQWLFDDLITPVLLTDKQGNIVRANREACRFLGYTHAELTQKSIKDVHLSRKSVRSNGKDTSLKTNHLSAFLTHMQAADGSELPVRLKMRKRLFKEESVIEYVMQDIRPEVELEQLRQDLTAMVFHDLRAPLQNIKFSIAALKRLLPDDERAKQAFISAESSVIQLNRMIASLLDIQRLEGGGTILNKKPIPLTKVAKGAVDQTSAIVEAAGLKFNVQARNDLPTVEMDADMIRRVMTNLIENATKYAPEGGQVTLRLSQEIGRVHIVVADNGPGIPEEMLERIFDKFSRVKYDDAPHGVGLGLAFCRLAVEAHGGKIWVESEAGKGAEFHFTIPAPMTEQGTPSPAVSGSVPL